MDVIILQYEENNPENRTKSRGRIIRGIGNFCTRTKEDSSGVYAILHDDGWVIFSPMDTDAPVRDIPKVHLLTVGDKFGIEIFLHHISIRRLQSIVALGRNLLGDL